MDWYRGIQFVAAVAMPPDVAQEFGTTVNGMWSDPEALTEDEVARAHGRGQRVLFSVPMIALTPHVYEAASATHLLEEVCRDVDGEPSECGWYYWESKPVFAACIYSDVFRDYLLERCRDGVDRGMDVVNLDEIMTSVGLMNRAPRDSGFCARCLDRFRSHLDAGDPVLALDDDALRARLREDDDTYERYRRFHELAAYEVMVAFIQAFRAYADERNPAFAISANVAYLGSLVPTFGALWGCLWGPHVDFVLMENHYRVEPDSPHLLLPRGSFAAWYRLGSSFTGVPTWICPSITVPRQLADRPRTSYHLLMFLEAYANAGRWGYYWWPGVDVETRLAATAPESLKTWIRFIDEHRELYEDAVTANELAILYADGPISRRPETHTKYLALAQALAERGFQFDVLFAGDGRFNPDELDLATLARHRVLLLPEGRDLGQAPAAALEAFARDGGQVVVFSESPLAPDLVRHADGDALTSFWQRYQDEDRDRILADLADVPAARITASDPAVGVTRFVEGDRQVFHVLNYRYDEATDAVAAIDRVRLRIPWSAGDASCALFMPGAERQLTARIEGDELIVDVPDLDPYALLVVEAPPSSPSRGVMER
jgi:hypothetical protein